MPISNPRSGKSYGLHVYPNANDLGTIGDPESIIWSSIKFLCSRSAAKDIASDFHGVVGAKNLNKIAHNLKLYINQAYEFYQAALLAKANTAPLFYYYSFLNLAKALCEIQGPSFHLKNENFHHGISRKFNSKYMAVPYWDTVRTNNRGVWHALWEALTKSNCPVPQGTSFRIKDLFLLCPEISSEIFMSLGEERALIPLVEPDILYDSSTKCAWIRFSINRSDLKGFRMSAPKFLNKITTQRSGYIEVRTLKPELRKFLRTFESATPVSTPARSSVLELLYADVLGMNLFCYYSESRKLSYYVPVQDKLKFQMPQVMVVYTILFWLGSLVRYDPHSIGYLMESPNWVLIDGFIGQSRIFLLEQFEWAFYQTETKFWSVR